LPLLSHHITHSPLTAPATAPISPLSLHDALPIFPHAQVEELRPHALVLVVGAREPDPQRQIHLRHLGAVAEAVGTEMAQMNLSLDRKSTRLNSSHVAISYAVFCLKKKKNQTQRKA